jgi:ABC-type dipeptide/oligopeptide/nickel transport system permease component
MLAKSPTLDSNSSISLWQFLSHAQTRIFHPAYYHFPVRADWRVDHRVLPGARGTVQCGGLVHRPKARPEDIARVEKQLGLDKPLAVQYAIYMGDLLRGDLGTSIGSKRPVLQELTERLPATLELLIVAMTMAILIGVPLGVLSARAQSNLLDVAVRTISIVGVSMPAFY